MPHLAYGDANDFATYWGVDIDARYEAQVNRLMDMAAANIMMALSTAGADSCTKSDAADNYLMQLNCILAAIMYSAPCWPNLKQDEKQMYLTWANEQLTNIRSGKLELCEGETGSEFPAVGWAEQGASEFAAARIISNDIDRDA